jgi:hypothetical protein
VRGREEGREREERRKWREDTPSLYTFICILSSRFLFLFVFFFFFFSFSFFLFFSFFFLPAPYFNLAFASPSSDCLSRAKAGEWGGEEEETVLEVEDEAMVEEAVEEEVEVVEDEGAEVEGVTELSEGGRGVDVDEWFVGGAVVGDRGGAARGIVDNGTEEGVGDKEAGDIEDVEEGTANCAEVGSVGVGVAVGKMGAIGADVGE